MPKSIAQATEENLRLGRIPLQILAQEDTLKSLEQKNFGSEVTLAAILAQLDITLSVLRDALRGAGARNFTTLETDAEAILARLDVNLSTRASQATLALILTQLDITLSAFRDALMGAGARDFTTLQAELANKVNRATTPVPYNVTMAVANFEYNQALPANTKKFLIHTRDGTAFRLAFITGKVAGPVAPYFTIPANVPYWEDFIESSVITLYFACGIAGKVTEIICWS